MHIQFPRLKPWFVVTLLSTLLLACGGSPAPPEPPPRKPEPPQVSASFIVVGDIMLSRGVDRAIHRAGDPLLPFRGFEKELLSTDFNFGNLESPISGNDRKNGEGLVFNAHTDDLGGLTKYKFKALGLANNHALDQRVAGLAKTTEILDGLGILSTGAHATPGRAWEPAIVEANGIRIGFLAASYASINDGGVVKNEYVARIEDLDKLEAAVARTRRDADLVVVTMHAGIEYVRNPEPNQIKFARRAIEVGADIVIGHHPHWIQTIEQYQGKYIFYSLGNFIFDQRKPDTKEGLTLRIAVSKKESAQIDSIEMIPVIIENFSTPRGANDKEGAAILRKIGVDWSKRVLSR